MLENHGPENLDAILRKRRQLSFVTAGLMSLMFAGLGSIATNGMFSPSGPAFFIGVWWFLFLGTFSGLYWGTYVGEVTRNDRTTRNWRPWKTALFALLA